MPPETFLAVTAIGPDRAGLVAELTDFLTAHGGNVEDSRMAVLGAEFGVLMLVSGTPDEIHRIESDLPTLTATTGLTFLVRRTKNPEEHRHEAGVPALVTAEALDYEGLVRAVSRGLHGVGVNIVSLETTPYEAPVSGSPLFRMEARVDVPPGTPLHRVRKAMDEVAEAENIDIVVKSLVGKG